MKRSLGVWLVLGATSALASTISLQSNATTPDSCASSSVCEWNNISGYGNANYVIPPANLIGTSGWAAPTGGATWVSYANSGWNFETASPVTNVPNDIPGSACPGYSGGEMTVAASTWTPSQIAACNASSPTGAGTPNGIFFEQFTATGTDITLTLSVWADDTVAVYLDGVEIIAANLEASSTHCDEIAPGLTPATGTGSSVCANGETVVNVTVPSGTNTLEFDTYQIGGATYGVMWDGIVTDVSFAPEPSSLLLLGTGLAAFTLLRRKRVF